MSAAAVGRMHDAAMSACAVLLVLGLASCDRDAETTAAAPTPTPAPTPAPIAAPACPPSGDGVSVDAEQLMTAPIAFDLMAGTVAPESLAVVDAVARRLRVCADVQLEIAVHTDAMRTSAFNARASQRIAELVRDRLIARGVDAARLVACGYGESVPNTSAPGWRDAPVNARVEWRRSSTPAAAFVCPVIE